MNRAVLLLLALVLVAFPGRASSVAARIGHARIGGRQYLRLTDWANSAGLKVRWLKRDESLQLSGHATTLRLNIDSRESAIDGLEVWLSFPVVERNGAVWLAQLDADTTLRPLLFPSKNPPHVKVTSICLDPGHGGKDPGYCVGANQEKKYTLLLAKTVSRQLERAGLKVSLTRSKDAFVELDTRPAMARSRHADLFVSLHFNATVTSRRTVHGAQVFCLTPPGASSTNARGEGGGAGSFPGNRHNDQNLFLAFQVQRSLLRELDMEDRGVRRARFAVLRDATMPAVLIEAGFMSHPVEGRKIFSAAYREKLARAIVDGILAYKRAVEK